MYPKRNNNGDLIFKDYPEFRPNLTPIEIFELGSFGGTYWRPIKSSITNKKYNNIHNNNHKEWNYPKTWWKNIPENHLSRSWNNYDININYYKVKVGQKLEDWEKANWITKYHPYGWMHWYCDFYLGKRGEDDERQINRWKGVASKNSGRFRKNLVTQILNKSRQKNVTPQYNDETISPKIRQTLQHWGYQLTKKDFNYEMKIRQKNK